jgi:hypothetical protein
MSELQVDEVFKAIYGQQCFQGSTYEKLRVGSPDEFDINLDLRLPVDDAQLKVGVLCPVLQRFNVFWQSQVYLMI